MHFPMHRKVVRLNCGKTRCKITNYIKSKFLTILNESDPYIVRRNLVNFVADANFQVIGVNNHHEHVLNSIHIHYTLSVPRVFRPQKEPG